MILLQFPSRTELGLITKKINRIANLKNQTCPSMSGKRALRWSMRSDDCDGEAKAEDEAAKGEDLGGEKRAGAEEGGEEEEEE